MSTEQVCGIGERAPGANYSRLDRLLHHMAFSGVGLQKSLADIEDRAHAAVLRGIDPGSPVFVSGLPRAGTTLLLEVLAALPGYAAHTYRAMPFVLCPMLWNSVSRGFRRDSDAKERAHGDGMTIGYDSPEAFEEVLWQAFWPRKYREGTIEFWTAEDRDDEFEQFFRNHLKKLIALDPAPGARPGRYVSKNNANIARIPLLRTLFPRAAILVPFRDPIDQAGSLLRQHRRFLEIHRRDPFARWYMEAVGHFEFGAGLKTIAFPGGGWKVHDPLGVDFWLAYWIDAYAYLCALPAAWLHFVDFDRLCADPATSLGTLADALHEPETAALLRAQAGAFHPVVHYDPAVLGADPTLVRRARAVQDSLRERTLG